MTVMMVMVYGDEVSFAPCCVMVDGSKMTSLSGRMSNTSWDGGGWTGEEDDVTGYCYCRLQGLLCY